MVINHFIRDLKRFNRHINGSTIEYDLGPYHERLVEIKNYEAQLKEKTDLYLKEQSKPMPLSVQPLSVC